MNEEIKYTLDLEDEKWQGPFDDPVFVTKLIQKEKRKVGKHFKHFRAITGVYNSSDIPSLHLRFPTFKSYLENLNESVGQKQDYFNSRVSVACWVNFHPSGCTVWFCHKHDYNFNKANDWTPYEPATENYISVEVEDNLTAERLEEE